MDDERTDEQLVKDAGSVVVGTPSGLRAQEAQTEMMRRLKNSIEKLDHNTERYNKLLLLLTVVLVITAIAQIVVSIWVSSLNPWIALGGEVLALGIIAFFAWRILKTFFPSQEE